MNRLHGWACLALLALASAGGQAAEPGQQLAFLRAYSQPEAAAPQKKGRPSAGDEAHRTLEREDFYDPSNPDLAYLQRHEQAMATLPRDANGFPDWMRALREGLIQPRSGLGPGAAIDGLDLDVIMKNTKEMPYVRFPHKAHTMWLDCSNCHPQPFEPRAGSTRMAMADIFRGKYCGMCHDRVAFITFFACHRCHSVPQTPRQAERKVP